MKNRRGVVFSLIVNAKSRTVCRTAERYLSHSHYALYWYKNRFRDTVLYAENYSGSVLGNLARSPTLEA